MLTHIKPMNAPSDKYKQVDCCLPLSDEDRLDEAREDARLEATI